MEYYESDEDEYQYQTDEEISTDKNNQKTEYSMNHLIKKYPEYSIWIKSLFEIEDNTDLSNKYLLSYENITFCKVVFLEMGEILGELILSIEENNTVYYPNAPPVLKWNTDNLKVKEYLDICYMEMVRKENWNLCYTILNILENVYDYILTLKLTSRNLRYNPQLFTYLVYLSKLTNIFPNSVIQSNLPKLGIIKEITEIDKQNKLNNGIGYSQGDIENWNTERWKEKQQEVFNYLSNVYELITQDLTEIDMENINSSCLKSFIVYYVSNGSIQDYELNKENYIILYKIVNWWYLTIGFDIELHLSSYIFYQEIKQIIQISKEEDILIEYLNIYIDDVIQYIEDTKKEIGKNTELDKENEYINTLKPYQLTVDEDYKIHTYLKEKDNVFIPSNKWLKRLMIEWKDLNKSLPLHPDGSIFINWSGDGTMSQYYKILITPSLITPYGGGCYLFDMYIPTDYPNVPPKLNFLTTGGGRVRFNPNLYNCGKVCLSLLGTWTGEKWNPSVSNLYQLLVSILGLIFVEEPYFNEPGYQNSRGTPQGDKCSFDYNTNIRIANIRYGIIDMIKNPPEEFMEIIKLHYQLRKKEIIDNINKWIQEYDKYPKIQNELKELLVELKKII